MQASKTEEHEFWPLIQSVKNGNSQDKILTAAQHQKNHGRFWGKFVSSQCFCLGVCNHSMHCNDGKCCLIGAIHHNSSLMDVSSYAKMTSKICFLFYKDNDLVNMSTKFVSPGSFNILSQPADNPSHIECQDISWCFYLVRFLLLM